MSSFQNKAAIVFTALLSFSALQLFKISDNSPLISFEIIQLQKKTKEHILAPRAMY